jgi:hypothetical protein
MLCQLVCTDRRYARMNCFNIRELQSILKNKFFTDLVNSHDHRDLLNQSMIGLRFKQNNTLNLDLDMTSFYKYGLHENNLNKYYNFTHTSTIGRPNLNLSLTNYEYFLVSVFNTNLTFFFTNLVHSSKIFITELLVLTSSFNVYLPTFQSFYTHFFKSLSFNFNLLNPFGYNVLFFKNFIIESNLEQNNGILNLSSNYSKDTIQSYTETSSNQRITRFNTVFVNYDYKTGHYLGNWDSLYPFLMNSFVEVAKGIKKPC